MLYHFVISDKENRERRERVQKRLVKMGIIPHFMDAIMGKDLSPQDLADHVQEVDALTLGEVGCALSHMACLRRFLETRRKSVVVFEDDIAFSPRLTLDVLKDLVAFVESQEEPLMMALHDDSRPVEEVTQIDGIAVNRTYRFMRAHAYIVNRAAARKILDLQTPLQFQFDDCKQYYYLKGITLLTVAPALVMNDDSVESTIESERSDDAALAELRWQQRKKNVKRLFWALPWQEKLLCLQRKLKKHMQ